MVGAKVQQPRRRRIAILVALSLGLGLLGLSVTVPASANLPGSPFDASDGSETGWATAPNLAEVPDTPSGARDSSLKGKEQDTAPLFTVGGIQNNKADITKIRVAHERVTGITPTVGDPRTVKDFLYLAWNRPADPDGNVDFDFELNQLAQPSLPAPNTRWTLNRSPGDLLLTFELLTGGTSAQISIRRWVTGGPCDGQPAGPCWSPGVVLDPSTSPAAEASVNSVDGKITFGETAIDLGLAGIFTPGTCTSFASVYAKSRSSGSSFTSELSDMVAPVTKTVSNCGSVTVAKSVAGPVSATDQSSFSFTLTCGPLVDLDAAATGVQTSKTFALADGASQTTRDIPVGSDCTVTEAAPAPSSHWTVGHDATATAAANVGRLDDVPLAGRTVTFTNTRRTGALAIAKTSTGGVGTFTFDVDCNDGTAHDRSDISITTTTPGTSVTSPALAGIPTGTVCTVTEDANSLYSTVREPSNGQIAIDADPATTQTVSFANTRRTATLTVAKTTSGGTGTFTFEVDCDGTTHDRRGASALTITDSGSATVTGIPTGTSCTVTETSDDRFTSTRTPTNGTVVLTEAGQTVSFTNVRNTGTLTVAKATTGGDGTFTFSVDCAGEEFDRTLVSVVTAGGAGSSAPIVAIPTGVSCTVSERVPAGWAAVGATTRTVVIAAAETVSFTNRKLASGIGVTKTASEPIVRAGSLVTYTYAVTNRGELPLTAVAVVDDKCAPVTFVDGDDDGDDALDLAETWTYRCASALATTTTNVATATGTDAHGVTRKATAEATVQVIGPAVAIDKVSNVDSVVPGETVVYTFTVTNPGDVPLSAVVVVDDKCAPVTFVRGDAGLDALLHPGEAWVFQCTQVQTGAVDTLTNVGTVTAVDVLGLPVSARDTVTITAVAPSVLVRPGVVDAAATTTAAGVAPPGPTPAPAPTAATATAAGTLPRTGADTRGLLQLSGSLILLGAALLVATPRIRRRA